ncbi:MAG: hypothetical protein HYX28_08900 [Candidatus Koribacter versatilis]|uniref:Uncharacterized protein n=1 Tax=Candidatus Korobacter versatilis TaxID=658062 RepID=A0A932A916_9BACT|nr:hypothetical protein [Candidatus Koribacter versatilis]
MYSDFQAHDRWSGKPVHCVFQALITAISTRHADAIDVKFFVDGRPVWIAMPHTAWVEFHARSGGRVLTDPLAIQAAGHYLKQAIEDGSESGREMYSLSTEETLRHVQAVLAEKPVPAETL